MTAGGRHSTVTFRPGACTGACRPDIRGQGPDDITLNTLALRIAEELAHLTRLTLEVQDGLSSCVTGCPCDAAAVTKLQAIDRLGQGIADLGRLMTGLTGELPDSITLPAHALRRDLRLRDLADRLVPAVDGCIPEPDRKIGDILWF